MKKSFLFISALLLVVAAAGCRPAVDEIVISKAPIINVTVNIAESFPPQVFVLIEGGLADGCTTFHDMVIERSGNTVNITVTVQRPKDAICIQVFGFFEKTAALGSDFISGETYTIYVNDTTETFILP